MDKYKTIIITGTSSGIGFTLAEYFGKQGHHVYGLSRKFVESPHFTSIPTDITQKEQINSAIKQKQINQAKINLNKLFLKKIELMSLLIMREWVW